MLKVKFFRSTDEKAVNDWLSKMQTVETFELVKVLQSVAARGAFLYDVHVTIVYNE